MTWLVRLIGFLSLLLLGTSCGRSSGPEAGPSKDEAPGAAAATTAGAAAGALPAAKPAGAPLRIAYSDWPGWVAWEIALQKGWFKEAGVEVDFKWFEYVPSMEAYSAGKVDAVCVTNGDALVTGGSGAPGVGVVVNDYSNGNDMVVARPGITRVAELKGKKVGVEVGFVSHLLLLHALKSAGLAEKDIQIVNVPTDQTPQTLKSGSVDAIVAWQPSSGQALRELPGSTAIFTSADVPGIIYDLLVVNPKSLAERRADWVKVVKVWDRIARFLLDERNRDEAARIMSARVGLTPEQYTPLLKGTFFLDLAGGMRHLAKGEGLTSVYGSSKLVDEFNVNHNIYKAPLKVEDYLDPSLTAEAVKAGQAP
ncbi:ABC transporter substrate-binding protein [Sorangium sp. So ce131]|uniref:ABC transporter substrate-binding protein n=1 Tax=Sorangium sp. So ce131 TaxID=3133282 RepID=UPI003F5F40A6